MPLSPETEVLDEGRDDLGEQQCRLDVVDGPDRGATVILEHSPFVVGFAGDADLVLRDPSVSRRHFEIVRDARGYRIVDCGSTNGTRLDRARIREAYLSDGQIIAAGRTVFRFGPAVESGDVPPSSRGSLGDLVGRSDALRRVFTLLARVARTHAPVLLLGETGTGKELAARAIHGCSARADKPLVVFDAGSTPGQVIESELFGHERGAFTGAIARRAGLFESANGGTLFLDEIGELPIDLQPRLLRALEAREVRRIGSDRPRPVDVRLIAATNLDIKAAVRAGTFREDLYWRLSVVEIEMPTLRARPEDVRAIADSLMAQRDALPLDAPSIRLLQRQPWPGNVRQLRNTLERALAIAPGGEVTLEVIRDSLKESEF